MRPWAITMSSIRSNIGYINCNKFYHVIQHYWTLWMWVFLRISIKKHKKVRARRIMGTDIWHNRRFVVRFCWVRTRIIKTACIKKWARHGCQDSCRYRVSSSDENPNKKNYPVGGIFWFLSNKASALQKLSSHKTMLIRFSLNIDEKERTQMINDSLPSNWWTKKH